MNIEEMTQAAEAGFIPEDPAQLRKTLEGLPEFFGALSQSLEEFGEFLGGLVGDETGAKISDSGVHAGAAREAASEAFLAYQHEASSWTG